jgi:hypothetical protein
MTTHKASLKTVFKKLNRNEPFSSSEYKKYNKQERALIRGIQLRNNSDKQTSINFFNEYKIKGKEKTKQLASTIRQDLEARYPKEGGQVFHEVSEFNTPKKRAKLYHQKRKVNNYLNNSENKSKNEKTYNRVLRAYLKYPNASLGELRHGVNSNWSQEYRVNHGFSRNYK